MKLNLILLLLNPFLLFAQSIEKSIINEGNEAYKKKYFEEATKYYQKAAKEQNLKDISSFNLGNSYYQLENQDDAIASYKESLKNTENNNLKSKALHNMGNAYYKQKEYGKSIESYIKSLELKPNQIDTKKNLLLAKRMLAQQQKEQDNQQKKQSQSNQPDSQNQDNPKKMPENEAKRLLQLMDEQDKKTQEKIRKGTPKNSKNKDW